MASNKKKADKGRAQERDCPFCSMSRVVEEVWPHHENFFQHLRQAEAEFLKAVRSLIDDRIQECEKQPKKATKIKVE